MLGALAGKQERDLGAPSGLHASTGHPGLDDSREGAVQPADDLLRVSADHRKPFRQMGASDLSAPAIIRNRDSGREIVAMSLRELVEGRGLTRRDGKNVQRPRENRLGIGFRWRGLKDD